VFSILDILFHIAVIGLLWPTLVNLAVGNHKGCGPTAAVVHYSSANGSHRWSLQTGPLSKSKMVNVSVNPSLAGGGVEMPRSI
jgi:hypothetical protein